MIIYVCQCSIWRVISAGTNLAISWRSHKSEAFITREKTPNVIQRKGSETSITIGFTRVFITESSPARITYARGSPVIEKDPLMKLPNKESNRTLSCQKIREYPMSENKRRCKNFIIEDCGD